MSKTSSFFDLIIEGDRPVAGIGRWLYERIRSAVVAGRLPAGMQVPSSRHLASEQAIARGTVVSVFERLVMEGYLKSKVGSGTIVCPIRMTTENDLRQRGVNAQRTAASTKVSLAKRAASLTSQVFRHGNTNLATRLFSPQGIALDQFPISAWSRVAGRSLRAVSISQLSDGHVSGYRHLREAIAGSLGVARGLNVSADQILIVSSVQQGLDIAARLLFDQGDSVWVEDPGYPPARILLAAAGARVAPIPVDAEGLDVAAGKRIAGQARLVHVTPAHQFPLGMRMSPARRIALLDWARQSGAWIFEDDYDGEFRYGSKPLPALQSFDRNGRVIYAASFSKTLFPALRIAYLVLPESLVESFRAAKALTARYASIGDQLTLTEFISQGHYARHVRRLLGVYAERREALIRAIAASQQNLLTLEGEPAGLSVVAWLRRGVTEKQAVSIARDTDVVAPGLNLFASGRRLPAGLVLGFGSQPPHQVARTTRRYLDALAASVAGR